MNRAKVFLLAVVFLVISLADVSCAGIQVKLFSPQRDYTEEARYYTVTASERISSAVLVLVENEAGAIIHQNIPMPVTGGIYAATRIPLTLPSAGEYRFHVGLTPIDGPTAFFMFTVQSSPAEPGLKNVTISRPPYHVGYSLEILTLFTEPPLDVAVTLVREGIHYPVAAVSNSGGLEVIGYIAPSEVGRHDVVVTWRKDSASPQYTESIPIYVTLRHEVEDEETNVTTEHYHRPSGCDIGIGVLGLALPLMGGFFFIGRKKKLFLFFLLLAASMFLTFPCSVQAGASFIVTNAADDLANPPPGSLRSIWQTINLSGFENNTIYFAPWVNEIELRGALVFDRGIHLDAFTGRGGNRLTFTLASGGYRHIVVRSTFEAPARFSANGIIFRGFGKNDSRNTNYENGGLRFSTDTDWWGDPVAIPLEIARPPAMPIVLKNSNFIDIVGSSSAVEVAECFDVDIIMHNCLFQGNSVPIGDASGALSVFNGTLLLDRTFVGYNEARWAGGAIQVDAYVQWPSIHNTIVDNLTGPARSGHRTSQFNLPQPALPSTLRALQANKNESNVKLRTNSAYSMPSVTLINSTLIDNEGGFGGAIFTSGLVMINSTLFGNISGIASGTPSEAISGVWPTFYATLVADDLGDMTTPQNVYMNPLNWNLYSVSHSNSLIPYGSLRDVFESIPPVPENRGGYKPVIPLKYTGPAEGRVPAALLSLISPNHPLAFNADVRGVLRNYVRGASIGSFEFGEVSIQPGNIQNSTTIVLRPNYTGQIRVRLVENINVPGSPTITNFLSDIDVNFELISGSNLADLPQVAATADNGRSTAAVTTLAGGTGTVRAYLRNKPSIFLDFTVLLDEFASAQNYLYVVTLNPNRTMAGVENTYIATFSSACTSATVSIRRRGHAEYIKRDLSVTITDSIYGTIAQPLTFLETGSYMFDFTMIDPQGYTHRDSKLLTVTDDNASLKVFRMSTPPFRVGQTLSLIAQFTHAPREIDMTLTSPTGQVHRTTMFSQNNRLDWEGFYMPEYPGTYTARLEYVDRASRERRSESFVIQVSDTLIGGGGGAVRRCISVGGAGCNAGNGLLALAAMVGFWIMQRRWKA